MRKEFNEPNLGGGIELKGDQKFAKWILSNTTEDFLHSRTRPALERLSTGSSTNPFDIFALSDVRDKLLNEGHVSLNRAANIYKQENNM